MNWIVKIVWGIILVAVFLNLDFKSLDMSNIAYMIMSVGIGIIMCLPKERKK